MSEDPRCCGSGTCIIDRQGRCWCGQQWDGQKMCQAPLTPVASDRHAAESAQGPLANGQGPSLPSRNP